MSKYYLNDVDVLQSHFATLCEECLHKTDIEAMSLILGVFKHPTFHTCHVIGCRNNNALCHDSDYEGDFYRVRLSEITELEYLKRLERHAQRQQAISEGYLHNRL